MFKIFLYLLLISMSPTSVAVEFDVPARGKLAVNGEIKAGDGEKFVQALIKNKPVILLEINSPGGNIAEALRIAKIVKYLNLTVTVRKNSVCLSSCFMIYIAAPRRNASGLPPDGRKTFLPFGILGIHRPYIDSDIIKNIPVGLAIKSQGEAMVGLRNYLLSELVPSRLIDEMMARPSNEIYYLTQEDIVSIGPYNPGLEEILISKCAYSKNLLRYHSKLIERGEIEKYEAENQRLIECEGDAMEPLISDYIAKFPKLERGYRPWQASKRE